MDTLHGDGAGMVTEVGEVMAMVENILTFMVTIGNCENGRIHSKSKI